MIEFYIIAFLMLFTNQKHKNMSLTCFVLKLEQSQGQKPLGDPWYKDMVKKR